MRNSKTITELRRRCFLEHLRDFDVLFWRVPSEAAIHWQPSKEEFWKKHLEFFFSLFQPYFSKKRLQQRYFLANFSKFLEKPSVKNSSRLLLLWLPNFSHQTKSSQHFDVFIMISGHAFMYLTRRVRSLMESFFVKFQVYPTNKMLLTSVLLWKICAIFLIENSRRFL